MTRDEAQTHCYEIEREYYAIRRSDYVSNLQRLRLFYIEDEVKRLWKEHGVLPRGILSEHIC